MVYCHRLILLNATDDWIDIFKAEHFSVRCFCFPGCTCIGGGRGKHAIFSICHCCLLICTRALEGLIPVVAQPNQAISISSGCVRCASCIFGYTLNYENVFVVAQCSLLARRSEQCCVHNNEEKCARM